MSSCTYCDAPLPKRHELDHFPVQRHLGGKEVVPACMNCHELKDRTGPDEDWFSEALASLPRGVHLLLWRIWVMGRDLQSADLLDLLEDWEHFRPIQRVTLAKLVSATVAMQIEHPGYPARPENRRASGTLDAEGSKR